jgi:hypothetical protein
VQVQAAGAIGAFTVGVEFFFDFRVPQRLTGVVWKQILLRDIGDVFALGVLGEQVIIGLFLRRADFFGDRKPPFLGVVEGGVDIENHAAKRKHAVPDDLSDMILRLVAVHRHGRAQYTRKIASRHGFGGPFYSR